MHNKQICVSENDKLNMNVFARRVAMVGEGYRDGAFHGGEYVTNHVTVSPLCE